MDLFNGVKYSFLMSMGFLSNSSTSLGSQPIIIEDQEYYSSDAVRDIEIQTSTRLNDFERFSLEKLKLNKQKLKTFKTLEKGWNGYDSNVIDPEVINVVENLLTSLDYQPQIFPTGRGTLQIENFIDEDNFVEVEMTSDKAIAYKVKEGDESEQEIPIDEVRDFINDLYVA